MVFLQEYLLFAIAIFLLLYFYFTRNFNHWKDKNVPFVKPIPFFGNIRDGIIMRHSVGEIFKELYPKTLGPFIGFFALDKPCLLVKDPRIIKRMLITDFQYFYDRSVANNKRDDPISSYNLFFLKNPDWKIVRSKVTPVFTTSKMKSMSLLIKEAANDMVEYLNQEVDKNSVVEMKDVCMRYTVDVITSTSFGVYAHSFIKGQSQFWIEAKRLLNWDDFLTSFRIRMYFLSERLVKLFRMKIFNPISINFLEERFWEIMNQRSNLKEQRNDLIDILLQLKNSDKHFIDGDILVAQAVTFFIAGFETSSSAMGFALDKLARHPEIQTKLRNEINAVYEKHGDINFDSLKEMEYLDMCFKETMRIQPVVPFLERVCNTDYVIPETGTAVDKGTILYISTLGLQHDPQYFPDPEVFRPERFSEDNKHNIDPFSYLPFGEGPRNCMGARFALMTVKYGLAYIIRNFSLEVSPNTPSQIKYNPNGVVLVAVNGIQLQLKKIQQ